jgi:AbiV family abortive infection protein
VRRLSAVQMAAIALEALRNSRRLLEDAATLAAQGRLPSAFMLAGLSADELGKHMRVTAFYSREGTDEEWRKFWRRFRNHTDKLGDVLFAAWAGDLTDEHPPNISEFHKQRLAATYVDLSDDGRVQTPANLVTRRAFETVYQSIERELEFCEGLMRNATPQQLAPIFERFRTSRVSHELAEMVKELGPEAAITFAIAMRAGVERDDALAFARQVGEIFAQVGSECPPSSAV